VNAPIMKCRPIAAGGTQVYFACPHCKDKRGKPVLHFHGIEGGLGHRAAHCHAGSGSPFVQVGYILELDTPATPPC
jgi:hypothetical protein